MRLITLALLLIGCNISAQTFSSLEERMSGQQFQAAGLEKLSAEELAALNEWLRSNAPQTLGQDSSAAAGSDSNSAPTAGTAEITTDRNGFDLSADRKAVYSRIDGTFTGWNGRTRFRLINGQVWEQVEPTSWQTRMEAPQVEIQPKMLGSWSLSVEGSNRTVRVKRIE